MSTEPATPPTELSTDVVGRLDEYSSETLRQLARYAESLAEYRARNARIAEGADEAEVEDLPDDVPPKVTIMVKEINENCYYYWQWRDGDEIESTYKGPVDSSE
ncbi:hypothetical protein [Natrinema gelatinilyticum]|uniref:hypothetical protein n=1 Tax=Natrinema gelatinilyticum TaxID=2961571 RepID=UPI0020C56550|nr:hypothetical protein [Natrinema gelatinilyticum]